MCSISVGAMRASTDRRFTLKCAELHASHAHTIPEAASDSLAEKWEEEPTCTVNKDPHGERRKHQGRDE